MARKPLSAKRSMAPPESGSESGLTLIACGALVRELLGITAQFPDGQVDLTCLPASWHNHPEKIVPGLRRKGRRLAVVYGDCGTGVEIDTFLESENVPRIPGPHCYEMYLQQPDFDDEMERELGTFFLTDYTVPHFERIIMQGMGLRRHPQLRDLYFGNYTRVLYIAQTEDPSFERKAMVAADELGLAYQYRFAGFGRFTPWVTDMVATNMQGD